MNDCQPTPAFSQGDRSVFLASGSPRRRELCTKMGLAFTVHSTDVDETIDPAIPPREGVMLLAARKAEAALCEVGSDAVVIAADTTVELDGRSLGKPQSEADALAMLLSLAGRTHLVHTGVSVCYRGRRLTEVATTAVTFRPFDRAEALAYIATGEPMDKAGAYGIQGLGGKLVEHIEGAFDNVVGLPTALLDRLLCAVTAA